VRRAARRALGTAPLLLLAVAIACRGTAPAGRRVLVLGFDGLDYTVTRDLMAAGRLPNFSSLAAAGSFAPLGTSIPPQSPVAWSTFITGLDPGGHGIFDFIHRDPATMAPYLSTTRSVPAAHNLRVGSWLVPLSSPRVESLRDGRPFWEPLGDRDVDTTIIRMPANFPPTGTATRELSGMGTPDILGTYGQFLFLTSDPAVRGTTTVASGVVVHVDASQGEVNGMLQGPDQPLRAQPEPMQAPFTVYVDATHQFARIVVGDEVRLVKVGEWTDWVPVTFEVRPWMTLNGQCRFYLKRLDPTFELYVSPVNLDPLAPALPISSPGSFARDLAERTGRFYTQGMPEETAALKAGLISTETFLEQARLTQEEAHRQFLDLMGQFDRGLLFYYFGSVDQVSHMLWRARDPGHPAYDAARDAPFAHVIDDLYVGLDSIVGEARRRLGPDDLLVVMSDHGFTSWRRTFNLNSWLRDAGYVAPAAGPGASVLGQVDLQHSRAYGLGLNGLYLNLRGRDAFGIVDPTERDALLSEISTKLLAVVDPSTGQPAITRVFRREEVFSSAGHDAIAPDLIVGYAKGTRASDESALGELSPSVFTDNRSAWSGDHCMDPDTVPGILLTNRALARPASTLQALAGAIVAEFGVEFPQP